MAEENLGTGVLTVDLNINEITGKLNELSKRMQSILNSASRKSAQKITQNLGNGLRRVERDIVALGATLEREMARSARVAGRIIATTLREAIADINPLEIDVEADTQPAQFDIERLGDNTVTVNVHGDTTHLQAAIALARQEQERSSKQFSNAVSAIGKSLGSLASLSGAVLSVGALGIAAAGAAQSIFALGAALAPAAGILAALPAVALGGIAAMAALKLAFQGVGDAFSAALTGDAKEFEKALEGLSPAAKAAAREVRALKPVFEDLQESVQEGFFIGIEGQITATAKALAGPLKIGLTNIAANFASAATGALSFVSSAEGVSNISRILKGTQDATDDLFDVTRDLTQGFLAVGAAVSEAFGNQLSSGISGLAANFGSFLFEAAESGKAVAWVDGALNVFAELGSIVANVGRIIGSTFSAAESVSSGLLHNLVLVTNQMAAFVKSEEGQKALINAFRTLNIAASQLSPILGAAVVALGNVLGAIAPVLQALGPALVAAITAVGTAITSLMPGVLALGQALATGVVAIAQSGVLNQLASAFSLVLTAVSPLLPIVAQLAITVGQTLAPVIAALAPVLGAAVAAVGSLITAASPLLELAGSLAAQIGPILTPILVTLSDVFEQFAPVVEQAARLLSDALAPILATLPGLLQPFLRLLSDLTSALFPVLIKLLDAVRPALEKVSESFVRLAEKLTPVLTKLGELAALMLTKLTPLLDPLIDLVGKLAGIFADQLARTIDNIVIPALEAFIQIMNGDVEGATKNVEKALLNIGKEIVRFFVTLPGQIAGAIGNTALTLVKAGEDLIFGLMNGIRNMAGRLADVAKNVVGDAVKGAKDLLGISSPSKVFHEIGEFTGQGLINGLRSMAGKVGAQAAKMAGSVANPFAGVAPGGALTGLSQPFATSPGTGTGTASFEPARGLGGARTVINNFTINEVGGGDATAQRVINRLVMAGGGL